MRSLWARKDSRGKVYFVSEDGKTVFTVETAHKKWPTLAGLKTATALERLKTEKVVRVEL